MRKLCEILRLSQAKRLSSRAIATSCGISPATVQSYVLRARVAGLSWPLPEEMDDEALELQLFGQKKPPGRVLPGPDWGRVHLELKKKHVTKALLWQEYREQHPDGYQYSQFCQPTRGGRDAWA